MSLIPNTETERFQYIRNMILNGFGYPVVNVEMTEDQLNLQITKQIQMYSRENPYMQNTITEQLQGDNVWDQYTIRVKDQFGRNITGIKEIYREDDNFNLFNQMYKPYFLIGNIQSMLETFTYYDMVRKVLRVDPEWTWDERTNNIRFYRKFETITKILIFYFYYPNIVDISEPDIIWIIEYQCQEQKEILGRIRGKVQSITTTVGTLQLDGSTLLQEQISQKKDLLEEMKNRHCHFIEPITIF